MKVLYLMCYLFLTSTVTFAQHTEPIPPNFVERMISNGKVWKAQSYDLVQVSGTLKRNPTVSLIIKKDKIEFINPKKGNTSLTYTLLEGIVDPILKTNDGSIYEVRFRNAPPVEVMRLRRIESPNKESYIEDIYYMH